MENGNILYFETESYKVSVGYARCIDAPWLEDDGVRLRFNLGRDYNYIDDIDDDVTDETHFFFTFNVYEHTGFALHIDRDNVLKATAVKRSEEHSYVGIIAVRHQTKSFERAEYMLRLTEDYINGYAYRIDTLNKFSGEQDGTTMFATEFEHSIEGTILYINDKEDIKRFINDVMGIDVEDSGGYAPITMVSLKEGKFVFFKSHIENNPVYDKIHGLVGDEGITLLDL